MCKNSKATTQFFSKSFTCKWNEDIIPRQPLRPKAPEAVYLSSGKDFRRVLALPVWGLTPNSQYMLFLFVIAQTEELSVVWLVAKLQTAEKRVRVSFKLQNCSKCWKHHLVPQHKCRPRFLQDEFLLAWKHISLRKYMLKDFLNDNLYGTSEETFMNLFLLCAFP